MKHQTKMNEVRYMLNLPLLDTIRETNAQMKATIPSTNPYAPLFLLLSMISSTARAAIKTNADAITPTKGTFSFGTYSFKIKYKIL